MNRVDKNESFKIPANILEQLNELSTGFLLFALDEQGEVQVYCYTDSIGAAQQVQNYAKNWTIAAERVHQKSIEKGLMEGMEDDPEEDTEESS